MVHGRIRLTIADGLIILLFVLRLDGQTLDPGRQLAASSREDRPYIPEQFPAQA
jgi:hypothetical protein